MPDSMIAAMSSEVPTGRRMKGSETFIAEFTAAPANNAGEVCHRLPPLAGGVCVRPESCSPSAPRSLLRPAALPRS